MNYETIKFYEEHLYKPLKEYRFRLKKVDLIEEKEQLSLLFEHDVYDVQVFVCTDYLFPELKENVESVVGEAERSGNECSCHKCKYHAGRFALSLSYGSVQDRENSHRVERSGTSELPGPRLAGDKFAALYDEETLSDTLSNDQERLGDRDSDPRHVGSVLNQLRQPLYG